MEILVCPELIDPVTLNCSVSWVPQSYSSPLITMDMIPELTGMGLLVFVIAFGGRIIRKQFKSD